MLGAIAGDIIGSVHESAATKYKHFQLFTPESSFTDDTVLTVAVAECVLDDRHYVDVFHKYYAAYPYAGYGGSFRFWAETRRREPYNSWGNGSAMRVSPVGFAYNDLETVLSEAERSAAVTHSHPEGIKGAQATAAAIFLARHEHSKIEIQDYLEQQFNYDLSTPLDEIRETYFFDVSCQGSVPQALRAFLEADDFEDAIRNAISLGGDADTMACIAGAVAHAFYGQIPAFIRDEIRQRLDAPLRDVCDRFEEKYGR